MEKELNIAAILKDKPNAKLWSPAIGECSFRSITMEGFIMVKADSVIDYWFSTDGKLYNEGEILLFPSKSMKDWSKFAWKKGDILLYDENKLCIFDKWANEDYTEIEVKYTMPDYGNAKFKTSSCYKETNEFVIKKYVSLIELTKGGKLNLSTLQIEKPKPEFKDGDIVRVDEEILIILKRDEVFSTYYHFFFRSNGTTAFNGSFGKCTRKYRLATDSEKQQLFDALAKENKAWDEDKKMLVDLLKKCEFEPMDWCLMRQYHNIWSLCQYAFKNDRYSSPYFAVGGNAYNECIPYNDSTKHLLGTTDEWKGGSNE